MSSFIWDSTSLPTGKVNGRPTRTPLNQYVDGTEWNTAMQAMLDARSAFLTLVGNSQASRATGVNSGDMTIGTANGLSLSGQALSLAAAVAAGASGALTGADKTKLDALTGSNSGDLTLAAVGAVPAANGASLVAQVLTLQPADQAHPGLLTILAQTIAGAKTFTDPVTGGSYFESTTGYPSGTAFYAVNGGAFQSGAFPFHGLSGEPDGASAIGFQMNTVNALSTAGAVLLSLENNSVQKFVVDLNGGIIAGGPGQIEAICAGASYTLATGPHTISATRSQRAVASGRGCRLTATFVTTGGGGSFTMKLRNVTTSTDLCSHSFTAANAQDSVLGASSTFAAGVALGDDLSLIVDFSTGPVTGNNPVINARIEW